MSQAEIIRQEVLNSVTKSEREGFLIGVIRAVGSLGIKRQGLELELETDKKDLADTVKPFLIEMGASSIRSAIKNDGGKNSRVSVQLNAPETRSLLLKLGIMSAGELLPTDKLTAREGLSEAMLRGICKGLFAAAGSASLAEEVAERRHGYHIELNVTTDSLANDLILLLNSLEMDKWRLIQRKYTFGVYLKDSKQIFDFLILVGATKAALELQNAIAVREMRNNLNRELNVNSANQDKTLNAALLVIKDIDYLEENGILQTLSSALQRTAQLRRENPEMSLNDLTEMLGDTTKSGIMHRMKKLQSLADKHRGTL